MENNMNIDQLIKKWEDEHSTLLFEYNSTYKMMTEREICECQSHMKTVLRIIEDLKALSKYTIVVPDNDVAVSIKALIDPNWTDTAYGKWVDGNQDIKLSDGEWSDNSYGKWIDGEWYKNQK